SLVASAEVRRSLLIGLLVLPRLPSLRSAVCRYCRRPKSGSPPTKNASVGSRKKTVAKAPSISRRAGIEPLDVRPDPAGSSLHVSRCGLGGRGIGRIDEQCDPRRSACPRCLRRREYRARIASPCEYAQRTSRARHQRITRTAHRLA